MANLVVFEVDTPNGTVKVQAPDNFTDEQIIAKVKRMRAPIDLPPKGDTTTGGTLAPLGFDTGIPLGDGPSRFLAGVGADMRGRGMGIAQLIPGVDLTQEVKDKRALDAPLMATTGGKAGALTSALIPATASMAIPGANSYTGAAGVGAALGLTEPTADGAGEKLWNAAGGGLAGVGGRAAGELVGRAAQPVASSLNPMAQRLAQVAQQSGIALDAAALTGSKPLQTLNAVFEHLPLTAGREAAKKRATQESFNRAVLDRAGIPGELATPDVLANQKRALGTEFERIAQNNALNFNGPLANDLPRIVNEASRRLTPGEFATVERTVDDILSQVDRTGHMAGTNYQGWRSELGRLSRGNDARAHYFAELKRALDNEFSAGLSGADAQAWREASRQYGNTKTIAAAQGGAGNAAAQGDISPAQLAQALAGQVGREGKALGRGDLNDLSRVGQLFVKDQVPNSGTAQRLAYQSLLTGGAGAPAAGLGFMATGSPTAGALYGLGAGVASLVSPRVVQAFANNPRIQNYIVRQSGSPAAAALADALRRMGPSVGLTAPALLSANGGQ